MKKSTITIISLLWFGCAPTQMPDLLEVVNEIPVITPKENFVIIPEESLPKGWVLNRETLAAWTSSLPEVLGIMSDTGAVAEYWDDQATLPSGIKLPIKRAKITYHHKTRLTSEVVELHFVNIDNIYSITNYESSHFEMNAVVKSVEILDTGFPQLIADDVLKHKVLMKYGTPFDFDGSWHRYQDRDSEFAVRVIDDRHLAVQINSRRIERQLKQAIQDVYSEEGIELRKQQLMDGFEL